MKENDRFFYYKNSLSQIGELETKVSLASGVIIRDPTRDKRLIEFCMNLADNQFVEGEYERRLVYDFSKDKISPKILEASLKGKGSQSSDTKYILIKNWDIIQQEITDYLSKKTNKNVINIDTIINFSRKNKEQLAKEETFAVLEYLYHIHLCKMLQNC